MARFRRLTLDLDITEFLEEYPSLTNEVNLYLDQLSKLTKVGVELDPKKMSWLDLGAIWLYELGTFDKNAEGVPTIYFDASAATTQELMKMEGTSDAKEKAINALKAGEFTASKTWKYG